jgi:hypothetical protein
MKILNKVASLKVKFMAWFMVKLGLEDVTFKILSLETKIDKMQTDIDGLKMEADILYANSLERE